LKVADTWIGKPRRHSALAHGVGHRVRHWPNLLIGDKGHRANFAGSVAALAVPLQNRQDIAVKSWGADGVCHAARGSGLRMSGRGRPGEKRERGEEGGGPLGRVGHSARKIFGFINRIVGICRFECNRRARRVSPTAYNTKQSQKNALRKPAAAVKSPHGKGLGEQVSRTKDSGQRGVQLTAAQVDTRRRREVLFLSRTRVQRDLQASQDQRYRDLLTRALSDLEAQLSALDEKI